MRSGFFFGSTDYDQHYVADLVATVEMLTPLIERYSEGGWFDLTYHSSW